MSLRLHLRSRWGRAVAGGLVAGLLWAGYTPLVLAQRLNPAQLEQFLADPLTDVPRDPALPQPEVSRALSPLEIYQLKQTLNNLNARAQALFSAGEGDEAFELWLREVRLQRVLGPAAELQAIERLTPLVWDNQRTLEIRLLTQRLRNIWDASSGPNSPGSNSTGPQLERLLTLLIELRDEDTVVAITQQLADQAAARGDGRAQRQYLTDLGETYLDWFEFDQAATVYEQLVEDVASRQPSAPEQAQQLLQQLIYSYQQSERYADAIPYQQRLLGLYREAMLPESEVALAIAIARNYRALANYSRAIEYYQLAYRTAQQLEQYGYSSTVLQDLGALYRDLDQPRDAIAMYNLLIRVEQQSYNHYGILLAYDQLGQLYRILADPDNALVAFRAGLAFAEALDYRQDYFQTQITELESSNPDPTTSRFPPRYPRNRTHS